MKIAHNTQNAYTTVPKIVPSHTAISSTRQSSRPLAISQNSMSGSYEETQSTNSPHSWQQLKMQTHYL
jgi:hypothetical protein